MLGHECVAAESTQTGFRPVAVASTNPGRGAVPTLTPENLGRGDAAGLAEMRDWISSKFESGGLLP